MGSTQGLEDTWLPSLPCNLILQVLKNDLYLSTGYACISHRLRLTTCAQSLSKNNKEPDEQPDVAPFNTRSRGFGGTKLGMMDCSKVMSELCALGANAEMPKKGGLPA